MAPYKQQNPWEFLLDVNQKAGTTVLQFLEDRTKTAFKNLTTPIPRPADIRGDIVEAASSLMGVAGPTGKMDLVIAAGQELADRNILPQSAVLTLPILGAVRGRTPKWKGSKAGLRKLAQQEMVENGMSQAEFVAKHGNMDIPDYPGETWTPRFSGTNKTTGKPQLKMQSSMEGRSTTTRRKDAIKDQTVEGIKVTDFGKDAPAGTEKIHHRQPPGLYQTFYDGLNPVEKQELARYQAEELMSPAGNHPYNADFLTTGVHDQLYHVWDRKGPIGVQPLQTGKTNFRIPKNATLEERKVALKLFSETVQVGMDEAMFAFQMSKQFPDNKHWINLAKEYMNEFLQRKIE